MTVQASNKNLHVQKVAVFSSEINIQALSTHVLTVFSPQNITCSLRGVMSGHGGTWGDMGGHMGGHEGEIDTF